MPAVKRHTCHQQGGFTLLEVLIALLVLSIGLLGLAALQTVGLRSNQMATMRTQATQISYDITDRMRANPDGLTTANQYYVIGTGTSPTDHGKDCDAVTCTSQELATFDLLQWRSQVQGLPDGLSSVAQTVTASGLVTHTITVYWNEERDPNAVGTGCNPNDATDLRCIQLTI
ncbi:MAG: type IV pilus modification protein PilV [Pseudomonadota bacterium]